MLDISDSSFRNSKSKLSREPFNGGLIPFFTGVLSNVYAKFSIITVVLTSLSLPVLNKNNFPVSSSKLAAATEPSPSKCGNIGDSMGRIHRWRDIAGRCAD